MNSDNSPPQSLHRVKAGHEPGFPRFKTKDRFPGFGFKTHGDGFRFAAGKGWRHGKVRLSGVREMTVHGEARTPGRVVCFDVQRKVDGWYLSLVLDCKPHRECGDREAGLDRGAETFATLAYAPGAYAEEENDGVHAHKLIVTEELAPSNMTASAKGTTEKLGRNVNSKAGLNRAILDATPGSFLNMLSTKAEEAGCELIVLNTRREKPSQTCLCCGTVRKKALAVRVHHCGCRFAATRDPAAALAMLAAGLRLTGREPTWARASEPETVHQSRAAA